MPDAGNTVHQITDVIPLRPAAASAPMPPRRRGRPRDTERMKVVFLRWARQTGATPAQLAKKVRAARAQADGEVVRRQSRGEELSPDDATLLRWLRQLPTDHSRLRDLMKKWLAADRRGDERLIDALVRSRHLRQGFSSPSGEFPPRRLRRTP